MTVYYIVLGSFLGILGLFLLWLRIKRLYREFDARETLREEIERQKNMINGAMSYIRKEYDNDFDNTPYRNIKTKVDFIRPIIEKRPDEKKLYYYRKLYERLYESVYRLKTTENVKLIILPLNTLIHEIVEEQLDYLRDNYEEQ